MTRKLLILGAGDFALEVADLVSDISEFQVEGFAKSEQPYEPNMTLLGLPLYWVDDLPQLAATEECVCAIGSTRRWQFVERVSQMGFRFATIIHPTARISRRAVIGEGSVISAGVVLATDTEIGKHVIINRGALVGHHTQIQDYTTISPGANLGGNIKVGRRVWVGIGAIVLEGKTIGEQSVVGAGAVVTRDVPARVQVMGIPAKQVAQDIEGH